MFEIKFCEIIFVNCFMFVKRNDKVNDNIVGNKVYKIKKSQKEIFENPKIQK